jgi:hypothetical protein
MNRHNAFPNGYAAYPRGDRATFSISPHRYGVPDTGMAICPTWSWSILLTRTISKQIPIAITTRTAAAETAHPASDRPRHRIRILLRSRFSFMAGCDPTDVIPRAR